MVNFLSKWFPKTTINNFLEVDMHSHLIPGIDDGVSTIEESIVVINQLKALGYRKSITTPHIMGDFFKNTPENINAGLKELKDEIKNRGIEFEIEAAAEYYLDEWFLEKLDHSNELLTFGEGYLLIETSYMNKPVNLNKYIFEILSKGLTPVLAHPERYIYMYDSYEGYKDLYERGVKFQININSLSGYYSQGAQHIAEKLIRDGMVDFLGTDCHGNKHIESLKKSLRTKTFAKINQSLILNNSL